MREKKCCESGSTDLFIKRNVLIKFISNHYKCNCCRFWKKVLKRVDGPFFTRIYLEKYLIYETKIT